MRSFIPLLLLLITSTARSEGPPADAQRPPGPLSSHHGALRCAQCHPAAERKTEARLCLACHTEVGRRIDEKRGLHGGPLARGQSCAACHGEHRGASADIKGWRTVGGMAALDHAQVGFPFSGGHKGFADSPCESCHERKAPGETPRFSAIRTMCASASCHRDPHAGSVGTDCARCHSSTSWRELLVGRGFDHNRETRFPLVGRHQEAARGGRCRSCHSAGSEPTNKSAPISFKVTDSSCYGCHRKDDEQNGHKGQRGRDCGGCHLPMQRYFWDTRGLPEGHNVSPQPLGGAHDRLPCLTCHPGWRKLAGLGGACISCHQRDDIHHNSLGPRCGDCHNQRSFLGARFRHDSVGCTLRGVHRVLPCADCHKGGNYAGLAPLCISCHRDDAMRAAAQGIAPELHVVQTACTGCHNTTSFRLGAGTRQSPPESVCQ